MKMKWSQADPCVFTWRSTRSSDKADLIAIIYVDNTLVCSPPHLQERFKAGVKAQFSIKELGRIRKHLGIWYTHKQNNKKLTYIEASMPSLVNEIVEASENHLRKQLKAYPTPGTPGLTLTKDNNNLIKDQTAY